MKTVGVAFDHRLHHESSRSVSTNERESMNFVTFLTMKKAAELNRLVLKLILLCQVDIQESSGIDNGTFNFLGII